MEAKAFLAFEHDYSLKNQFAEYALERYQKSLSEQELEKIRIETERICNRVRARQSVKRPVAGRRKGPFNQIRFDYFCGLIKELDSVAKESGDFISVSISADKSIGRVHYRTDGIAYEIGSECAKIISLWHRVFTAFSSVEINTEKDKVSIIIVENFHREGAPYSDSPPRFIRLLPTEKKGP